MHHAESVWVETTGRGSFSISERVQRIVGNSGIDAGLCSVFVHHTSASLMICENADPDVRRDLDAFLARLVPDGDPLYRHVDEGPDDMPAHVRSILTQASLTIPVQGGRCDLGTWQGLYVLEHRLRPHRRRVTVTVVG